MATRRPANPVTCRSNFKIMALSSGDVPCNDAADAVGALGCARLAAPLRPLRPSRRRRQEETRTRRNGCVNHSSFGVDVDPIPGTFGVETDLLMRDSHALVGLAYAAASLVGGFGSLWVGIWAARPFSQTQRGATS